VGREEISRFPAAPVDDPPTTLDLERDFARLDARAATYAPLPSSQGQFAGPLRCGLPLVCDSVGCSRRPKIHRDFHRASGV